MLKRLSPIASRPLAREALIILAFFALTSLMTWPWVTHMRDAVIDPGDPYLLAWAMWWDYHQTFTDPLHLFDANIFYPLRYALAFSENCYGIALLFFPLYALGMRPLTVHSIATFSGFALSGYGAFRLARTLTKSYGAAWIAGIFFAFVPYRFHLLSQVHYVFAAWMPLSLEALVLFARARTWRRAVWLAVAVVMSALTCVTWFIVSLPPLALTAIFLVERYGLWRERDFWQRGAAAAALAAVVLIPFFYPYYYVSRVHGFTWGRDIVEQNSPAVVQWLSAETRNKLWDGLGSNLKDAHRYKLFPGLLAPLFALLALLLADPLRRGRAAVRSADANEISAESGSGNRRWVRRLDFIALAAGAVALLCAWRAGASVSPFVRLPLSLITADRAMLVLVLAVGARCALAYPRALRRVAVAPDLRAHVRSKGRGAAIWVGSIWVVMGFLMSLGTNSWLYRLLYDFVFIFRGMRFPPRAAMVAYLGLAVLAGLGARRLAEALALRQKRFSAGAVVVVVALLFLFELRAAPLRLERGAVYPDEITLRLKETPMRGGLVEFPTGGGALPHLYMLRSADHGRPLINAISTFVPPHSSRIDAMSLANPIPTRLLDLMEEVPTSYLVIHNRFIPPAHRRRYEEFLTRGMAAGRLRFIRRFGEGDDLYAVTKTEPDAAQEAEPPYSVTLRNWPDMIRENPVNLLGQHQDRAIWLYRLYVAAYGRMPQMNEFMPDVLKLGRGLLVGIEELDPGTFLSNARALTEEFAARPAFVEATGKLSDAEYVERLFDNARLTPAPAERDALIAGLSSGAETRASVLRKIVGRQDFEEKEHTRGLVLLHYFGYLKRNPTDPPDQNLDGFNFWVREVETSGDPARLTSGFKSAFEYWEKPRSQ